MKKIFLALTLSCSLFLINGCSKSDVKPTHNTVATQDISEVLSNSIEFTSFVAATNNILATLDQQTLSTAGKNTKVIPSANEFITKAQMQTFISNLHLNEAVYFQNRQVMAKAIKSFQEKYDLSNEQSASIWNYVINTHSESFRSGISLPNVPEIIDCGISAGTTFAATYAVCLALREIPIIGEQLFRICEQEAINNLIDSLLGCIQL